MAADHGETMTADGEATESGPGRDIWIFGYGSLMWKPGFDFLDRTAALLHGRHRALCVWSRMWRGTEEAPGLVLGLDRGGACRGIAYRVVAEKTAEVIAYLDERELGTPIYRRRTVGLRLPDGQRVQAETYVVDRNHPHYAGGVDVAEAARIIRTCEGRGGTNLDYLENTLRHLDDLGLPEGNLHALHRRVCEF